MVASLLICGEVWGEIGEKNKVVRVGVKCNKNKEIGS